MKGLFVTMIGILFLAGTFQSAYAQTEKANWLISGSGSFQHLQYEGDRRSTSIEIYPKGGLFVVDNLAVGLMPSIDINISKEDNPNSTYLNTYNLSVGPFVRYYYTVSSKIKLFAEGYFTYGWQFYKPHFTNNDYHLYKWRLGPGIAFFLSNTASLDASIGIGQTGTVEKGDFGRSELTTGITDIQLGFSIYLPGK